MIDWEFIRSLEGKLITTGYVPHTRDGRVIGRSGVTIASGFDIGQWTEKEIYALPLSLALRVKLYPYVQRRAETALSYIKDHPLVISTDEANQIDRALKMNLVSRFDTIYKLRTGNNFGAGDIVHERLRTVVISLVVNFGPNIPNTLPKTFKVICRCVKTGDNTELVNWLRHFPSKNPELKKRRTREADYLSGVIPATPVIIS